MKHSCRHTGCLAGWAVLGANRPGRVVSHGHAGLRGRNLQDWSTQALGIKNCRECPHFDVWIYYSSCSRMCKFAAVWGRVRARGSLLNDGSVLSQLSLMLLMSEGSEASALIFTSSRSPPAFFLPINVPCFNANLYTALGHMALFRKKKTFWIRSRRNYCK